MIIIIISTALDVPKRIFAVLYVSVTGLTRCYKTTVFYIYYVLKSSQNVTCSPDEERVGWIS